MVIALQIKWGFLVKKIQFSLQNVQKLKTVYQWYKNKKKSNTPLK